MKLILDDLNDSERRIALELGKTLRFTFGSGIRLTTERGAGLTVTRLPKEIRIRYGTTASFCRGLATAAGLREGTRVEGEECDSLCAMIDCSRGAVMNLPSVKRLARYLALMGYSQLQLYTEDTYEVEGEPYFGYQRGRYTAEELREIDAYCRLLGIELVPCVQTLAHLNAIFRWREYQPIRDAEDVLLADDARTERLLEHIFAQLAGVFTSRQVHIGMDEAHAVGRGKYLDLHGPEDRYGILLRHLDTVCRIAERYGFTPMMWSDMFFRLAYGKYYVGAEEPALPEAALRAVPPQVGLVYWDYYHDERAAYDVMFERHADFTNETTYAGGAWSWTSFAPLNALSVRRNAQGIRSAKAHGIRRYMLTAWGNDGGECSIFSMLPCFAAFADEVYGSEHDEKRFAAVCGIGSEDLLKCDLPNGRDRVERPVNPCKYLLFNDCFYRLLDSALTGEEADDYRKAAECLRPLARHGEWGYLFGTLYRLCKVLRLKADLGKRTGDCYRNGDRAGLKALVEERYRPLLSELTAFAESFVRQWERDNKPCGLEVHLYRLYGLRGRIAYCIRALNGYLAGERPEITELSEETLDFLCGPEPEGKPICFYSFAESATANRFSW